MYKLYVLPNFDYGDVIYHIPPNKCDLGQGISLNNHMEELESVQYSAGLALTGAWKGTSYEKLYLVGTWLGIVKYASLEQTPYSSLNKFVYNITPDYTRSPFQNYNKLSIPYADLI